MAYAAYPKDKLRRYHYKAYFPEDVKLGHMLLEFFQAFDKVNVTSHGASQLLEDKRGVIPLPSKKELLMDSNTLVEFYERLDDKNNPTGIIQKALIRVHNMDPKYDNVYLVSREGVIISGWRNDKNDEHRLDHAGGQYYKP